MNKVTVISASPSEKSRLNGILNYVNTYLEHADIELDVIEIRNLPAEDLIHANFSSEEIQEANNKIADSSFVVILTPIYKSSFSGLLKTYLDLLPQNSLDDKTILPISIGGTFGHLLMIDYALKPVLCVLGATHILKGVFVLDSQVKKLGNHLFELEAEVKDRLNTSLNSLEIKSVSNIPI
ncbi:NADPH-dependent FMN reductase [Heyndrickxia ginsengihumi]|uniref:NADPH-dependent FMN reductase n=1 Tax=Heyndrickxia ginsengihumi TaxID=363870 RepID=UPI003D1A09E9